MSFVESLGTICKLDTYDYHVASEVKYYEKRGYEEIARHPIEKLHSSCDQHIAFDKFFLKKTGLEVVHMEKKREQNWGDILLKKKSVNCVDLKNLTFLSLRHKYTT